MQPKKIALITGGSRGLGKNMALAIASKGIDVLLTYHANEEAALEVCRKINELGQQAHAFQLDTRNVESFPAFARKLENFLTDNFGQKSFDFLINNAGTALYMPITETTIEQVNDTFDIHFKGVFFLTQQLLPLINDGGSIINISSGLTRITMPGAAVYGAMKAAVETFTRYLAQELGERKIRANVIAPGAIETDFGGGRTRDNKEINARIAGLSALGRV